MHFIISVNASAFVLKTLYRCTYYNHKDASSVMLQIVTSLKTCQLWLQYDDSAGHSYCFENTLQWFVPWTICDHNWWLLMDATILDHPSRGVIFELEVFLDLSIMIVVMLMVQTTGTMIVNYNHNTFIIQATS